MLKLSVLDGDHNIGSWLLVKSEDTLWIGPDATTLSVASPKACAAFCMQTEDEMARGLPCSSILVSNPCCQADGRDAEMAHALTGSYV